MKRLGAVVVIALAGFVAALVQFDNAAAGSCMEEPDPGSSHSAAFAAPVDTGQESQVLLLSRDGRPVSGAHVCLSTEMEGMTGMGMSADAREVAPGRYEVPIRFPMPGTWEVTVAVAREEGAAPEVAVPMKVDVKSSGMG
ncbi:MAG TPA: FixH family protein [Acidimicrobiales bacterium]|nr:FixH family protein [Acidimicrobiales bacterium]